jgi:hypothetical protein
MNALARSMFANAPALLATGGPWLGRLAFIGVFVALLVWLVLAPDRLIGNVDGRPPWWRNARVWAILVCVTQIVVYLHWG